MTRTLFSPLWQRTLGVVYRFCDISYFPLVDATPPVRAPLLVTIPSLRWRALAGDDVTYRFSLPTLTESFAGQVPSTPLDVEVESLDGTYHNFEPFQVTLPVPLSSPPRRSDFLFTKPLWPTRKLRLITGETAIAGSIVSSSGSQPIEGLKVVIYGPGGPIAGGPYMYTDASGDFLFRLPFLQSSTSAPVTVTIAVSDSGGPITVTPPSLTISLGEVATAQFIRN